MQSPLRLSLPAVLHGVLRGDGCAVTAQRWSAWGMMLLGRGRACPIPECVEKEMFMGQRQCYMGWVGMPADLGRVLFCRSQRRRGKLILRAELPGRCVAEISHCL